MVGATAALQVLGGLALPILDAVTMHQVGTCNALRNMLKGEREGTREGSCARHVFRIAES